VENQVCRATNVAGTPRLLHREVAGALPVFTGDRQALTVQGCGPLATQELAAAEEEGETTARMFALLQEQHHSQMEAMAAVNQKSMDAILEQMNAMLAGQGKAADKENVLPANTNSGTGTGRAARKKKRCPHCRKHVF
jgi:hypothetical protein